MQRRHFEALAEALKAAKPKQYQGSSEELLKQWENTVEAIARVCNRFNPNFNIRKFQTACDGE